MNLIEAYKKVKPAVVALVTVTKEPNDKMGVHVFGSGVCVHPSGIFVTAKHCIQEDEFNPKWLNEIDFYISFARVNPAGLIDLTLFKPQEMYASQDEDFAVMKYIGPKPNDFSYIDFPDKPEDRNNLQEGEDIGCAGFPVVLTNMGQGKPFPSLFSGIISNVAFSNNKCVRLMLDISIHKGNSGGPVFNSKGQLLGIISRQDLRESDDSYSPKKWVWTNLVHCVPYTSFYKGITDAADPSFGDELIKKGQYVKKGKSDEKKD